MLGLAIETTTYIASVAVGTPSQVIDYVSLNGHKAVGSMLIPTIENIFRKNSLTIHNIDAIFVDLGPGSYTGIRMGGLVAKTISVLLNKKYYGLYSLEITARYYEGYNLDKVLITVLDAKSNMIYMGIYNAKEVASPQLVSYDDFFKIVKIYQNPKIITFDSAFACRLNTIFQKSNMQYTVYEVASPTADKVLKLGFYKLENNEDFIYEPVYLKKSYAEEKEYNILS